MTSRLHAISRSIFAACALWLILLGLYFVFLRPALLPEDARFIGAPAVQIETDMPGLATWLKRVFTVMGGFMVGAGALTGLLARRDRMPRGIAAVAGLLTVTLMAGVNFAIVSDFRWVLTVPSVAWWIAFGLGAIPGPNQSLNSPVLDRRASKIVR